MQKVTFKNQYQMKVVGNLFVPKNLESQRASSPAIVVGHPMGAVKEQSANLYATKLAEQGFVTLSFDLSFWGESEGQPRNTVAPDIYAEDFSAAVDFLRTQPFVDKERIGALGICGSGSFVISAAQDRPAHQGDRHGQHVRHGRGQPRRPAQRRDPRAAQGGPRRRPPSSATPSSPAAKPSTPAARRESSTTSRRPIDREFYDFYRTPRGISPEHHDAADAEQQRRSS